jgi:hypothetical protein
MLISTFIKKLFHTHSDRSIRNLQKQFASKAVNWCGMTGVENIIFHAANTSLLNICYWLQLLIYFNSIQFLIFHSWTYMVQHQYINILFRFTHLWQKWMGKCWNIWYGILRLRFWCTHNGVYNPLFVTCLKVSEYGCTEAKYMTFTNSYCWYLAVDSKHSKWRWQYRFLINYSILWTQCIINNM